MKKTALLVVDVQQALVEGGLYEKERFLYGITALLGACRKKRMDVIFVRHDDGPGCALSKGNGGWQLYSGIVPLAGEPVVDKRFNSALRDTGLKEYLESRGIGTLILTGLQTEYCIDATCKAAFEAHYQVLIPEGCTTTLDNGELTAAQLCAHYRGIWQGRFARVLPLKEVLSFIQG